MREITLTRTQGGATSPDGTFGVLDLGHLVLQTVEDDWKDNQPGESCIPVGRYLLKRTVYHHGGYETFWVTNVPGRDRILIHRANTEEDVKGCIGVGMRRGKLSVHDEDDPAHPMVSKDAVVASHQAHTCFMEDMTLYDEAMLTVQWAPGLP
jgi:hypothetical protein